MVAEEVSAVVVSVVQVLVVAPSGVLVSAVELSVVVLVEIQIVVVAVMVGEPQPAWSAVEPVGRSVERIWNPVGILVELVLHLVGWGAGHLVGQGLGRFWDLREPVFGLELEYGKR